MRNAIVFEIDSGGLGNGVVMPEHFEGAAIAGPLFLNHHDAVSGLFLAPNRARRIINMLLFHLYEQKVYPTLALTERAYRNPISPSPGILNFPNFLPSIPPEMVFIILRACVYCFNNWLTS